MIATIDKRIRRYLGQIRLAFRGVGTQVNSAAPVQLFQGQGLAGEQLQDNELMQHYGFTSRPPPGFMYVCLPIGGKTAHGIAVATEHASYRLKGLKSGEMAIYDDLGQQVLLSRDGIVIDGAALPIIIKNAPTVTIKAATKVRMETPLLEVTGEIKDKCDSTGKTMQSMRTSYNTHTHHENDVHGETAVPTQQV